MIGVGELICDPDFCTEFIIRRKIPGKWRGGRQVQEMYSVPVVGLVTVASGKDMEMLPEGDRVHGLKTFYTDAEHELRVSTDETLSDTCEYKGQEYRLLQVYDYSDFGFYKAIGTRIGGI